jgi:hypothetical protein
MSDNTTRRRMLTIGTIGAAGLAGAIATGRVQANPQKDAQTQVTINPQKRFTDHVVLTLFCHSPSLSSNK